MGLSDDILATPGRLTELRHHLTELRARFAARACFLVDEVGTPFATVGHLEYPLPHPLASLPGSEEILTALVGESKTRSSSELVLERITSRALLVIVLERPVDGPLSRRNRRSVQRASRALTNLLDA